MKKLFLLSVSFALTFANLANANPPLNCPGVAAIQAGGVSKNVLQEATGLWFAGRRHMPYGTTDLWTFLLGDIPAANSDEAYTKAANGLLSLKFQVGPFMGPFGKWVCMYSTSQGYPAVTITTPIALRSAHQYLTH